MRSREELRARILANAARRSLRVQDQDLRVVADPYAGWRIYVVSPDFEGMPSRERREALLAGIDQSQVQWCELLTPVEAEWSGGPPREVGPEDVPMWPEALARGAIPRPVRFASDLDQDLPLPFVVTFYSLRGGVGRSTALAYTARTLARRGHSVLCVDMDLEAPGLSAIMGCEEAVGPDRGVVELLLQLEQGGDVELIDHVVRLSESDELYLLPAGRPGADYARKLRLLDPESWYREQRNPLHRLIELADGLPFKPEAILIDARTGLATLSAPLLFDVSDLTVIAFFPHPQARLGTGELVRALLSARSRRSVGDEPLTPEPRFLVSPVPSGRGGQAEKYRVRAMEWIGDWLARVGDDRRGEPDPEEITRFVPYREVIAVSDGLLSDEEVDRDFAPVADWVERFLPTRGEPGVPGLPERKRLALGQLVFSTGTAEDQDRFHEVFVETDVVEAALRPDALLVLGRKGTGKTAVFRRIAEDDRYCSAVVLAPASLRGRYPWVLGPDAFRRIEEEVGRPGRGWREFWALYVPLSAYLARPEVRSEVVPAPLRDLGALREGKLTERRLVGAVVRALGIEEVGLTASEWLERLGATAPGDCYLLLDGLDTGFGHGAEDRRRRTLAIEGLFAFVLDRLPGLGNYRFKVLLREDIWRQLRFENKSHLYGRTVRLQWRTQADYLKTALAQAVTSSDTFHDLISEVVPRDWPVSRWSAEQTLRAWNVLAGERMRGGKTAFTYNWVWNRMADGNGDHGPRALLQLCHEAVHWERRENERTPYDRSVIRPRALIESLGAVSDQAVEALREEFKELDELIERLQRLGRSPVEATDLEDLSDEVQLAREVGLLQVYEGTEQEVQRYRIPDLYRVGLRLTRRGPS
ncbi:MAG TPA: ParA family protein [Candidatus Dormibacteraeota bacterium]|nr:ParA family protein [Candidatus Dormibacteraeota bacterium]